MLKHSGGDSERFLRDWLDNQGMIGDLKGPNSKEITKKQLAGLNRLREFVEKYISGRPLIIGSVGHSWSLDTLTVYLANKGEVTVEVFDKMKVKMSSDFFQQTPPKFMQKRVFIVHGWDGNPQEGWFPWLKRELESRGFFVTVPQLPKAKEPRIKNWVPALKEIVGTSDEQTYFVGHSMGCQTIARYLESLPENVKVGGVVFVAGFFKRLTNLEDDEVVRSVADEWLDTPIDLVKVNHHLKKSVAIFSDNDQYVPLDNQQEYRDILGSKIIIEHAKGHFSGSNNISELPSVLESILEISA